MCDKFAIKILNNSQVIKLRNFLSHNTNGYSIIGIRIYSAKGSWALFRIISQSLLCSSG